MKRNDMARKINLVERALVAQCALVGKDDFFHVFQKTRQGITNLIPQCNWHCSQFDCASLHNIPLVVQPYQDIYIYFIITIIYICKVQVSKSFFYCL